MPESIGVKHREPVYITPYLPEDWLERAKKWEVEQAQPVFVLAMDGYPNQCKNCGGNGLVYMVFCKAGPFHLPTSTKKLFTWFDGDMIYPKGWYEVETTVPIPCPECHKDVKQ
jgi:hypothetical protein